MKNLDKLKNLLDKRKRKIIILSFLAVFFLLFFYIFYDLPNPYKLKDFQATPLSTQILDRNGKLLYDIYKEQNRTPIKIKEIPAYIGKATIAIEDKDFYRHQGVSLLSGILRAARDTFLTTNVQG